MIAFLYPGQGAQHASMFTTLPDSAATRATLEEAAELLGPIERAGYRRIVGVDHECPTGTVDLRGRFGTHTRR